MQIYAQYKYIVKEMNMNLPTKTLNNESGQMAILVMLVLVVALTIGLTALTRTVTNIKQSTITNESNQAYSAAEAGIEDALRGNTTYNTPQTIGSGPNAATFVVSSPAPQGNSSSPFAFPNPLDKDEAQQIWLFNYNNYKTNTSNPYTGFFNSCSPTTNCNQLTVYWGSSSTIGSTTPALEAAFIYKDTGNNFGVDKYAIDPNTTRGNNFSAAETGPTRYGGSPYSVPTTQGTKTYYFSKKFTLDSSKQYLLLRLKLLYNSDAKHEVAIDPDPNNLSVSVLPSQGQVIDSQGTAGDAVRKVRVYQSYPTLPSIFDFVLFNGSSNALAK
jgi:hypothetical protein